MLLNTMFILQEENFHYWASVYEEKEREKALRASLQRYLEFGTTYHWSAPSF